MLRTVSWKHAVGAALLLFACGCSRSDGKKVVYDITPPEQHEIAPSGTVRRVFGGGDGTTLVEKHTPYADGTLGHVYYRTTDGTVREAKEEYKDGRQKSFANYAEDGKTVVNGEIYRPDGTLYLVVERLESGKYRKRYFARNGKYNFVTREQGSDNAIEDTYFREDKTVWAKVRSKLFSQGQWQSWQDEWVDIYKDHESARDYRKEQLQTGETLYTYFDRYGRAEWKQLWKSGYDQENFNNMLIAGIDELDYSGEVARGLVFKEEKGVITLVEARFTVQTGSYPNIKKEVQVRKYREGEKLDNRPVVEEWKDERMWIQPKDRKPLRRLYHGGTLHQLVSAKGTVLETHEASESIREKVDLQKLRRPQINTFEQARQQFWGEQRPWLGHRDDTDPCRWYHK